jgi:hypothetical protein
MMSDATESQVRRMGETLYQLAKVALDFDISLSDFRRYYAHVRFHGEHCDRCNDCIINSCDRACIEQDAEFNEFILEVVTQIAQLEPLIFTRIIAQDLSGSTQESAP